MMAVTTIKDVGTFLNLIKQNVQLAGFVAEDIEQLIYTHLL